MLLVEERTLPRKPVRIVDINFDMLDSRAVLELIVAHRQSAKTRYIALVNPHSVMLCRRDMEMRRAIERAWVTLPDGVGIVLGACMLSQPHHGRTSGPELMLDCCNRGRETGLRHYFYGGGEGVAQTLARRLDLMFPGLSVAGIHTPPFRDQSADEDDETITRINDSAPDVLWVGLGAPKQEKWMHRHASRFRPMVMVGVGAAFDFHSGRTAWCPPILRRTGLEWAYRLAHEPRRLWRRNLDSFRFLGLVAGQLAACEARRNGPRSDNQAATGD